LEQTINAGIRDKDMPLETCPPKLKEDDDYEHLFDTCFFVNQSKIFLPTFTTGLTRNFTASWGIPIHMYEWPQLGSGAFSEVLRARIHPDYNSLGGQVWKESSGLQS